MAAAAAWRRRRTALICAAQAEDDSIKVVLDYLSSGEGLHSIDIRQYPEEARQLFGRWESLVIRDGVYHTDGVTKFLQVVLLAVLRRSFVEKLHAELGHFGRAKTALAVSRPGTAPCVIDCRGVSSHKSKQISSP